MTLEQIKDLIAFEYYKWEWYMLTDAQKTTLIDKIADQWADMKVRAITSNTVIQAA